VTVHAAALGLSPSASAQQYPSPNPHEYNWIENLALLLRAIDEEIARRMQRGITAADLRDLEAQQQQQQQFPQVQQMQSDENEAKQQQPQQPVPALSLRNPPPDVSASMSDAATVPDETTNKPTLGSPSSTVDSTTAAEAGGAAAVLPSLNSTLSRSSVDDESSSSVSAAPLSLLLSSASLIHSIVSWLFAFNNGALLQYFFDTASVHALHFQTYLIIVALEYEAAEARWQHFVEAAQAAAAAQRQQQGASTPPLGSLAELSVRSVMSSSSSSPLSSPSSEAAGLAAAISAASPAAATSLWRRHRTYLQSVLVKSPFPFQLTHVIPDLAAFEASVAEADAAQGIEAGAIAAASLAAPPTRFCLILICSYLSAYVRDTFVYAPRQLDDPLLQTMNTAVVYRVTHMLMQQLIMDGDNGATPAAAAATSSFSTRRGLGALKPGLKGKGAKIEPSKPKWTRFIFAQITRCIDEFELAQQQASTGGSSVPAAAVAVSPGVDAASDAALAAVSRLTREWCPLLPLSFCRTLPDFMYALFNIVALTKNNNNPNGVQAQQKVSVCHGSAQGACGIQQPRGLLLTASFFCVCSPIVSSDSILPQACERRHRGVSRSRAAFLPAPARTRAAV
jgi:hypothetical protein